MRRNLFFHYLNFLSDKFLKIVSTFTMRMIAFSLGVHLGKKTNFRGLMKFRLYKESVIEIGHHCVFRNKYASNLIGINHPCIIATHAKGAKIKIGNNCGFSGTVIGSFISITLGDHVRCGANTIITDGDWHTDDSRAGRLKPVIIENNVWLGVNSVVMKGVKIGENSVIGAGSVVTKDIPANVFAAGNPCSIIKYI